MIEERQHTLGTMRQAKICTAAQKHNKHVQIRVAGWGWTGSFNTASNGTFHVACTDSSEQQHFIWIDGIATSDAGA